MRPIYVSIVKKIIYRKSVEAGYRFLIFSRFLPKHVFFTSYVVTAQNKMSFLTNLLVKLLLTGMDVPPMGGGGDFPRPAPKLIIEILDFNKEVLGRFI